MSFLSKTFLFLFCISFSFSVRANDLDFISHIYLLDNKYEKNIETKAYLVTRDQIVKIFSDDNSEVSQKTNKELYGQEIFLLVRCKNFGEYRSFGTLNCKCPGGGIPIAIEIMMMSGYMKSFRNSVLPMYSGTVPDDENTPVIICEWKSLYKV